jgi:Ca2+/Na+ antiporter
MNNTQQPKPDRRGFAIVSFVLGIISLIAPRLISLRPSGAETSTQMMWGFYIAFPLMILSIITGLIGLILGIIGLRSSKKIFAIVGILLCGVVVFSWIILWFLPHRYQLFFRFFSSILGF